MVIETCFKDKNDNQFSVENSTKSDDNLATYTTYILTHCMEEKDKV